MATLYVDTDDTLVIYSSSPTPYGVIQGKHYKPNEALIDKIKKFKGKIVIWSGGGANYADKVAHVVLPNDLEYSAMTKWIDDNIKPGDIIVDDQFYYFDGLKDVGVKVYNPFEDWSEST